MRTLLYFAAALAVVPGCQEKTSDMDGQPVTEENVGEWVDVVANDSRESSKLRASAVMDLFLNRLRGGQSSAEIGALMGRADWLDDCEVNWISHTLGPRFVDFYLDSMTFEIDLFPKERPVPVSVKTRRIIAIRLGTPPPAAYPHSRSRGDLKSYFQDSGRFKGVILLEYALVWVEDNKVFSINSESDGTLVANKLQL